MTALVSVLPDWIRHPAGERPRTENHFTVVTYLRRVSRARKSGRCWIPDPVRDDGENMPSIFYASGENIGQNLYFLGLRWYLSR